MPARCSVYIDAGYLLASAATRVTGTSLRSGIHVEFGRLIEGVRRQAEAISAMPVLRVYWYDSARNAIPDIQQQRIGELPRVKLRLGRFGIDGQQKGVDLRLGLDLVTHARNKAADVFLLVSGDDDFTEAVEEAQGQGVEVVLLAAPDAEGRAHAVSRHLRRAADELHVIDGALVDEVVLKVERPAPAEPEGDETSAGEPADSPAVEGPGSPAGGERPDASEDSADQASSPRRSPQPTGVVAAPAAAAPRAVPRPGGRSARPADGAADTASVTGPATPSVPKPGPAPRTTAEPASAASPARPEPAGPSRPAETPAAPPTPPTSSTPATPQPAAPQHAAPRTPKDIAGAIHRLEGDGVPLPPDGAVRAGTWAEEFRATVTAVVGRVLNSLALSSTPLTWRALELGRPSIPREVDKALLLDVTAAMGVLELSDLERHEIREAFWAAYDTLVAAARA